MRGNTTQIISMSTLYAFFARAARAAPVPRESSATIRRCWEETGESARKLGGRGAIDLVNGLPPDPVPARGQSSGH